MRERARRIEREILNEYFSSVFTIEKSMDVREFGEINSDVLRSIPGGELSLKAHQGR